MPRHDPPRLASFSYLGFYRYFVTLRTSPRRAVFVSEAAVAPVCTQLRTTAREQQFAIFAYCFMRDHLHVLLEGLSEGADFRHMMMLFKQASAYHFRRTTGQRLWGPGYYERVLRDDEASVATARYIFQNPVRGGLALRIEEYPYLGSDVLSLADIIAG